MCALVKYKQALLIKRLLLDKRRRTYMCSFAPKSDDDDDIYMIYIYTYDAVCLAVCPRHTDTWDIDAEMIYCAALQ